MPDIMEMILEEGRQEGLLEAREESIAKLLAKGRMSPREVAEILEIDPEIVSKVSEKLQNLDKR